MSKKEQNENILQAPSIKNSEEKALSSAYFEEGNWPESKWWEKYNSKELKLYWCT